MSLRTERKRTFKSPEQRRADLLEASIEVFKEKGIAGATVADITEAAGVAKGTFYLYFQSREHLLLALREEMVNDILDKTARIYERLGRDDWWGLVDTMTESMIELMFQRRDAIAVFLQEGLTAPTIELFGECDRKLNDMLSSGIQMGIDAGVFKVSDPRSTAALLHHAIEGAVKEAIMYDSGLDESKLVAASKELVHKALAP